MNDDPNGHLPVIDSEIGEGKRSVSVAGLLLAAGGSSRFEGGNKLLVSVEGEPLVRQAAKSLVGAGIVPRLAVLGKGAVDVQEALEGLGFEFVHNPDYAAGQSTSVRQGVDAISTADAVVIALGDMPRVDPASIRSLVRAYESEQASALAAACDGRRGNPVLFDRKHFEALSDIEGDSGGRKILLESDDAALVETGDPGVLCDVDTRADLAALEG